MGQMTELPTDKTNEISSALRCRLSEVEAPEPVDPEAQHRHLLLQGIARDFVLEAQQTTRQGPLPPHPLDPAPGFPGARPSRPGGAGTTLHPWRSPSCRSV